MKTALVTGGSGYVAGQLVALLLDEGFSVNTTVRDPRNTSKTSALDALAARHPGRLRIFAADLLDEGSFDAAAADVDTVFHVASPFYMAEQITDPQAQLIEPALVGTRNVLGTVNRTPGVRRVVLTSTIGAMFGDYIDTRKMKDQVLTEEYFNSTSSLTRSPYHYSKVLAEKEAWRLAAEQDRWDMVVINPGLVLGPSLTAGSESGSLFLLDELMSGTLWFGVPDISFAPVDVRDVARAHLNAAIRPQASGRYIVSHPEMISFIDMARVIKQVHRRPILVPRNTIPVPVLRAVGPAFGLDREFIAGHVGIRFRLDNTRSVSELGITYRPVAQTLTDHYRSWQQGRDGAPADGGVRSVPARPGVPTALVTGASSGIGRGFAGRLAERGHDLVLVARRVDRLETLAEQLRTTHGVTVTVIGADLADPHAPAKLLDAVTAQGISIGVLVNAAGFGTAGPFVDEDPDRVAAEIAVDVTAPTLLARHFLPSLVTAGSRGALIMVSSTASHQPVANLAVYAAAKAFITSLTAAIWQEHHASGMRVIALCPGPTDTEFFEASGSEQFKVGRVGTVDEVLDAAFDALDRNGDPVVTVGWGNRIQALGAKLAPRRMTLSVGARQTARAAHTDATRRR